MFVTEFVNAEEDLLWHIDEDGLVRLPGETDFGIDDGHKLAMSQVHSFFERNVGENVRVRLVPQIVLDGLLQFGDFLLVERLDHNLFRESRELFLLVGGSRGSSRGSSDRSRGVRFRETNIIGLDESETVEDEVHSLRVLSHELLHHGVDTDLDVILLVFLVSSSQDRTQVEVDLGGVVLLDVLLEVETSDIFGDGENRLVDPAGIVANAGERSDEIDVDSLGLRLEIAQVQVAGATDELLFLHEALGQQLVAVVLSVVVGLRSEGVAELVRAHLLNSSSHFRVGVEENDARLRQTMSTFIVEIDVLSVVEGSDVEQHRALSHLEMNFGVLKNELVAVVAVQQLC